MPAKLVLQHLAYIYIYVLRLRTQKPFSSALSPYYCVGFTARHNQWNMTSTNTLKAFLLQTNDFQLRCFSQTVYARGTGGIAKRICISGIDPKRSICG